MLSIIHTFSTIRALRKWEQMYKLGSAISISSLTCYSLLDVNGGDKGNNGVMFMELFLMLLFIFDPYNKKDNLVKWDLTTKNVLLKINVF